MYRCDQCKKEKLIIYILAAISVLKCYFSMPFKYRLNSIKDICLVKNMVLSLLLI